MAFIEEGLAPKAGFEPGDFAAWGLDAEGLAAPSNGRSGGFPFRCFLGFNGGFAAAPGFADDGRFLAPETLGEDGLLERDEAEGEPDDPAGRAVFLAPVGFDRELGLRGGLNSAIGPYATQGCYFPLL